MSKSNGYPPHLKFDWHDAVPWLAAFVVVLIVWGCFGFPGLKTVLHWHLGGRYPTP